MEVLTSESFIIVALGDFQSKEIIGDTWYPTSSMRVLKYFLEDTSNHNERIHQLYFIGSFIQANLKHIFFVKLDSIYGE